MANAVGRNWALPDRGDGRLDMAADVPTWFVQANELEWLNPIQNTFAFSPVADPNATGVNQGGTWPGNFFEAWPGMFTDQDNRTIGTLANGGHNDYYGNEVYSCNLGAEVPLWTRNRDATVPGDQDQPVLSDGRPASNHCGENPEAAEGRWFLGQIWAYAGTTGNSDSRYLFEFDHTGTDPNRIDPTPGVQDWIDYGFGQRPSWTTVGRCMVFDPISRQLIKFGNGNAFPGLCFFMDLDDLNGPVLTNNSNINDNSFESAAIDTTNRVMLFQTGNASETYWWLKVDNDTNRLAAPTPITLTGPAAGQKRRAYGYRWHAASGAFLSWDPANPTSILKLTPTVDGGGNYTAVTVTQHGPYGTAAGALTPVKNYSENGGVNGRITIIDDFSGGQSLFVLGMMRQPPNAVDYVDSFAIKLPLGGI